MAATDDMVIVSKAMARFQQVSPRKARQVADRIRGLSVIEAQEVLAFNHRPSAIPVIANLLKSAVANVDHSSYPNTDDLVVGEIQVDGGPIGYRMRFRGRARTARIRRRSCHISIKLAVEV